MKLTRRVLRVDIYGKEVDIKYPTVAEFKRFEKDSKAEGKSAFDSLLDFLEPLGLPREIGEDLEAEHLNEIVAKVSGNDSKN